MQISNLLKASLVVLPLFFVTACEDKAEKRAKLEAQYEHYFNEAGLCGYAAAFTGTVEPEKQKKCDEAAKKAEEIKVELDALNGIK